MNNATVHFESGVASLSVRKIDIHEAMSQLFTAHVTARSPDDIDLSALVGRDAGLHVTGGLGTAIRYSRHWTGICARMKMVRAEESSPGLNTYELVIVPQLWRLKQRKNNRLFQHISIPDVIDAVLADYALDYDWRISRSRYPRLELRTQYDETDYHFFSRLLEEAGIAFFFEHRAEDAIRLVLSDEPQSATLRERPISAVDEVSQAQAGEIEYLTKVTLSEEVRPGRVTLRDYDFRHPAFPLYSAYSDGPNDELLHEQYLHTPGRFKIEAGPHHLTQLAATAASLATGGQASDASITPVADDLGMARHHHPHGDAEAKQLLESLRTGRQRIDFESNCLDLAPGVVMAMIGHPLASLAPGRDQLLVSCRLTGETSTSELQLSGTSVFADVPYRPAQTTRKPRLYGIQSATVVGPLADTAGNPMRSAARMARSVTMRRDQAAQERYEAEVAADEAGSDIVDDIYTDEYGRVRVQFHWDRLNDYDQRSSMWMRVSQGWAGGGYGMFTLPRVGHEVLVAFLDGDPDQPLVVGRVHNATERVPHKLPDNKTVSTWKSSSSPGGGGFNELRFDDAREREHVYLQAERDMDQLIKHDLQQAVGNDRASYTQNDEVSAVGCDRTKIVQHNELEVTGAGRVQTVGLSRQSTVGAEDSTIVGSRWAVTVARGLTPRLVRNLGKLFEGALAPTLRASAESVLGIIPNMPLGGEVKKVAQQLGLFRASSKDAAQNPLHVQQGVDAIRGPLPTSIEMVDRRIELTTGEASIILDGPNITLQAEGNIAVHGLEHASIAAEKEIAIAAGDKVGVIAAGSDILLQAQRDVHLQPFDASGETGKAPKLFTDFVSAVVRGPVCVECGTELDANGHCPRTHPS